MSERKISGMMHMRLPFYSLEDISFEGAGAEVAGDVLDALKAHLASKAGDPDTGDEDPVDLNEGQEHVVRMMYPDLPFEKAKQRYAKHMNPMEERQ